MKRYVMKGPRFSATGYLISISTSLIYKSNGKTCMVVFDNTILMFRYFITLLQ